MRKLRIMRKLKICALSALAIYVLVGCASGSDKYKDTGYDEGQSDSYAETSRDQFGEDETTSKSGTEEPTASVLPNEGTTEEPTDSTGENTATKDTSKDNTEKVTDASKETNSETTDNTEESTSQTEDTTKPSETLEPFYMSKTSFSVSELTYTRLQYYIQNNPGDIVWASEDASVAQIVNDELIGINVGTTTITGTSGDTTATITVQVEAMYEESEEAQRIFGASEHIYLWMDEAEAMTEDDMAQLMTSLEDIVKKVEAVTGYSFTSTSEQVEFSESRKRIVIQALDTDEVYVSTDELVINVQDMDMEQNGAYSLVSGLIQMVQLRNTVDIGAALTGGYYEYLQGKVCEQLSYETIYDAKGAHLAIVKAMDDLSADNLEERLLYPDNNSLSYFLAEYIAITYGDGKLKELADAITGRAVELYDSVSAGQASLFTEEEILTIIEQNTSDNLMNQLYEYIQSELK